MSPPSFGFSILITSAPWSARNIVPKGPAPYCSTARTRTPVKGSTASFSGRSGIASSWHWPFLAMTSGGLPLHELARDHDALELVRAFADREERRVAVVALNVEFLRVAISAVDAHRLEAVLQRRLGREKLRHAGFEIAAPAGVIGVRRRLHQQPRGFGARRHVGELQLDRLVLGDRFAEGPAKLRVPQRLLQTRAREPCTTRRDVGAPELEPVQHLLESAPFRAADQVSGRHPAVDEQHLARVDAAIAELLELAHDIEA